jgi:hypothetical protein
MTSTGGSDRTKTATKNPAWENTHKPGSYVRGLFSDFFNVAASRPAQITTG